ncbi:MAG TPA: hypothetical protein VGE40_11915 [Bacilli bacterium]
MSCMMMVLQGSNFEPCSFFWLMNRDFVSVLLVILTRPETKQRQNHHYGISGVNRKHELGVLGQIIQEQVSSRLPCQENGRGLVDLWIRKSAGSGSV